MDSRTFNEWMNPYDYVTADFEVELDALVPEQSKDKWYIFVQLKISYYICILFYNGSY